MKGDFTEGVNVRCVISRERSRQSVYVGLGIHKLGATTGHRLGKITGTCSSALEQGTSDRFILCEVMHDAASDGGDSGGPVWVERVVGYSCPNPPLNLPACFRIETDLLGIHWRRGGGVSPIWDIEAELGALKTY